MSWTTCKGDTSVSSRSNLIEKDRLSDKRARWSSILVAGFRVIEAIDIIRYRSPHLPTSVSIEMLNMLTPLVWINAGGNNVTAGKCKYNCKY
jgi:hypothetical protein